MDQTVRGGGAQGNAAAALAHMENMSRREEAEHDFKPLAYFPWTTKSWRKISLWVHIQACKERE